MISPPPARVHATTVAIGDRAVLLMGPSGCGKSDLALRLIDRGATLVSDDYTELTIAGDALLSAPPPTIAGRIEVRGLGIVPLPYVTHIRVALVVQLDQPVERMPPVGRRMTLCDRTVPVIALDPFEPSAPIKVELALRHVRETG